MCFVSILVVHPFSSNDTVKAWKKSYFILSEKSDFYMINNLSVVVYTFTRCRLILLSVDDILLLKYVNWSTNSRCLPLKVEMTPSCLKHIYLHSHRSQCLLLLAPGCAVGIRLGLVSLWEVLDYLCSLHLS